MSIKQSFIQKKQPLSLWDVFAISIIFWIFVIIKNFTDYMYSPVPLNLTEPISLDPIHLPKYALYTVARLTIAIFISIIFSFVYALIAVKNEKLRKPMIALLDILQSIPVLGYIAFSITGFVALFPGNTIGFELTVIFAAFTCQVWNITYSIYQSILTIPENIKDASKLFNLSPVQKFLLVELPYSIPSMIWNTMISISNSWFFIVAAEAIIEGNSQFYMPGIGSYIASAIQKESLTSITYAIITMSVVILICDQLVFRPLVEWSSKFKYEYYSSDSNTSFYYKMYHKSKILEFTNKPFKTAYSYLVNHYVQKVCAYRRRQTHESLNIKSVISYSIITLISLYAIYAISDSLYKDIGYQDIKETMYVGLITTIRIMIVMFLTMIIWVPVSIYVGMHPNMVKIVQPIALLLASFPANLLFPLFVVLIKKYSLNPEIWLSILIMLSIQWYVLFNTLYGIDSIPKNLIEAAKSLNLKGKILLMKIILPAVLPSVLIGAITAWGCAWNTVIISEIVEWGNTTIASTGLGAYVAIATDEGDTSRIILGILIMLFYIELFNKLLWRPLFKYADNMEALK